MAEPYRSKIRDPQTGRLKPPPHRARPAKGVLRTSTAYYKRAAEDIMARTDLRPVDKKRMLDMIRAECSLFREATKAGEPALEPAMVKVKLKPPSGKYLQRRARAGHTRPEVLERKREGGRIAYPKMQAVLQARRERAARLAERRRRREIEREVARLV